MDKRALRIIFLGNPEFALQHLIAIRKAGFNVVAVVSAPDKPAGRGLKLNATPVAVYAREQGIDLLQPPNLKSEDFLKTLASYNADLQVVIAFRMLPEAVWNMPPMGTVNLHASLLPNYRGAAPINWAIINGEKETGVSTFLLKHEIDTGDLLMQESIKISPNETAGTLHDKLMFLGCEVMIKTLEQIADESTAPLPQTSSADLKMAKKIFNEDTVLDFNKSVQEVDSLVRGMSPFPTAKTLINSKILKVFFGKIEQNLELDNVAIGEFISDGKTFLKVRCSDGFYHLTDLQLEGKKRMLVEDFLRGFKL